MLQKGEWESLAGVEDDGGGGPLGAGPEWGAVLDVVAFSLSSGKVIKSV